MLFSTSAFFSPQKIQNNIFPLIALLAIYEISNYNQ